MATKRNYRWRVGERRTERGGGESGVRVVQSVVTSHRTGVLEEQASGAAETWQVMTGLKYARLGA